MIKNKKHIEKLQAFHSSLTSNFENDEMQYYIVFQLAFKYFKMPSPKSNQIMAWKSNGLSEESIKPPTAPNNSLAPGMTFLKVPKFDGESLKKEKKKFHHRNIVN